MFGVASAYSLPVGALPYSSHPLLNHSVCPLSLTSAIAPPGCWRSSHATYRRFSSVINVSTCVMVRGHLIWAHFSGAAEQAHRLMKAMSIFGRRRLRVQLRARL